MKLIISNMDHLGGVMVSMLDLSAEDRGFDPRLGQTKDIKIGICCSAKALRCKNKDWLAKRIMCLGKSGMSSCRLLLS